MDGPGVLHADHELERPAHRCALLSVAKQRNPEICVIMIASDADIELATEAMRQSL